MDIIQGQQSPSPGLSSLDTLLKTKGISNENIIQAQQEEEAQKDMTQVSFSLQSTNMARNTLMQSGTPQNSLLESVMAAASTSTAESSSERTAFGKQTAANMLQGMEKDHLENNISSLLDGLRTDLESQVEEHLEQNSQEQATLEESIEAQLAQSTASSEHAVAATDGTPAEPGTTAGTASETSPAEADAKASPKATADTSATNSENTGASPATPKAPPSVDVYV